MRNPVFGAFMLLVIVLAIIRAFWPYLLAIAAVVVIALILTAESRKKKAQEAARRRTEEVRRWLRAPAPPLMVPSRFSDKWFAANVPRLHPGQVGPLLTEMRARGWTDQRIAQRVGPYLARNPFLPKTAIATTATAELAKRIEDACS